MKPLEPIVKAVTGMLGLPLGDPTGPLPILDGIVLSPDPGVAKLQRRVAGAAQKLVDLDAKRPPSEQVTFSCQDCLGIAWIPVPCSGRSTDGKRRCTECSWRHGHMVARPCWSCERGLEHLAGMWFRRMCRKDRKGNAVMDSARLPEFERAMLKLRFAGPRVRAVLDRMIAGESACGPEESVE